VSAFETEVRALHEAVAAALDRFTASEVVGEVPYRVALGVWAATARMEDGLVFLERAAERAGIERPPGSRSRWARQPSPRDPGREGLAASAVELPQ
jgi:hypothetical protein